MNLGIFLDPKKSDINTTVILLDNTDFLQFLLKGQKLKNLHTELIIISELRTELFKNSQNRKTARKKLVKSTKPFFEAVSCEREPYFCFVFDVRRRALWLRWRAMGREVALRALGAAKCFAA